MRKLIALILFVHFFLLALPFSYFCVEPYNYATSSGSGSGIILMPIIFLVTISIALLIIFYILKKIYKQEYFTFNVLISIVTYFNCIFIYYWDSVYVYQLYDCDTCYTFVGRFFTTLYFVLELILTFFVLKKCLKWKIE